MIRNIVNCWKCSKKIKNSTVSCDCIKKIVLPVNHNIDYFTLLNLEKDYKIDLDKLDNNYKNI